MSKNPDQKEGLQEKLEIIKNLSVSNADKILMVLVLLDEKQADEIHIIYKEKNKSKVDEINAGLIGAGLETQIGTEQDIGGDKMKVIYYSKSIETAKKVHDIFEKGVGQTKEEDIELGRIFCFPETAIQTYTYNWENTIGFDDLPEEVQREDYSVLLQFAVSKDNWREEMKKVKQMADKLKEHVPDLWQEYVEAKRERNRQRKLICA